jgi:hypothetical protein
MSLLFTVVLLMLCCGVSSGWAAITEVGTSFGVDSGNATVASLTFAVDSGSTGSNRVLICGVARFTGLTDVTSVTYGGEALTLITGALAESGSSLGVEMWYRLNPLTGSNNVEVTPGELQRLVAGCVTLAGVNQSTPFRTAATDATTDTSSALAVTSVVGDWVVSTIAKHDSAEAVTTDGSQTQEWNDVTTQGTSSNNVIGVMSSETASGTSTTMTYTWGVSRQNAHTGVAVAGDTATAAPRKAAPIFFP